VILGVLESRRQVKVCLMVSFQNLFFYDHLRLRKCVLCLILLFSPLEEVFGKTRVWCMVKVNPIWWKMWFPYDQGINNKFEWIIISILPHQEFLLTLCFEYVF
jgi:hypothetical protein